MCGIFAAVSETSVTATLVNAKHPLFFARGVAFQLAQEGARNLAKSVTVE